MKLFFIQLCLFVSIFAFTALNTFAEGTEDAVQSYSKQLGLILGEKAKKTLKLEYIPLPTSKKQNLFEIPVQSLVYFGEQVGIYRHRENWFKLIPIQVIKRQGDTAEIKSIELLPGDRIVTHGSSLLRVADMEASGGKSDD